MAVYPIAYVGQPVTADFWNSGQWDYTVKGSAEARASTTTLADDGELAGIALPVGTIMVEARYFVLLSATDTNPDIKIAWTHSGTATGIRKVVGYDNGLGVNSYWDGAAHQVTSAVRGLMRYGATGAFTASIDYGLRDSFNHCIEEDCVMTVTVAGNLDVQWAQQNSDTTSVSMNAQSFVRWKQIG